MRLLQDVPHGEEVAHREVRRSDRAPRDQVRLEEGRALLRYVETLSVEGMYHNLLNAKRISQMVIDVVVSAELLQQAAADPDKRALATIFITRHMLSVRMNADRISSGDATRLQRYETILGLE